MTGVIDFLSYIVGVFSELNVASMRWVRVVKELERLVHESTPIVLLCVSFAAVVTILESSYHMNLVIGDDSLVPGFAAVLILRELGAVVTALLLSSRVGASIAAEVANQTTTEQVEALRLLGIKPRSFIVIPKLLAMSLGVPILTVLANVICLAAAGLVAYFYMDYSADMFVTAFRRFAKLEDLWFLAIKGFAFGAWIPLVATFLGFRCRGGAQEVGMVTTWSVIWSSVGVIVLDFVLTLLFSLFY